MDRVSAKPLSRRRILKRAVAGAFGVTVAGSLGESCLLEVTRHRLSIASLPPALSPLKVAFAADFHLGAWFPAEKVREAVDAINSLGADLVLLGGDYVTESPEYYPPVFAELSRLSAPMGVYAVPGNHDNWAGTGRFLDEVSHTGIVPLVNEGASLGRGALWIAGLDDMWGGGANWRPAAAGAPPGAAVIALCHNPYSCEELPPGAADVILAGHTHGWQVYVPLVSRAFIPSNMSKYRCGFYPTPAGLMYVTRGVGLSLSRFRWRCRPEVALFELCAAPQSVTARV